LGLRLRRRRQRRRGPCIGPAPQAGGVRGGDRTGRRLPRARADSGLSGGRPVRRRWWGTLRLRVTAAAVLLLTAALVVSVVALAGFLRGTLRNSVEHHLDNQINEVVALARRGELPAALAPTGRESGQLQVIAADGRVVARSSGAASAARFDVLARPAPGARVAAT